MKQFVAITMFVVFLLLMLAGCADRAIVPEVTSTPTTEPNAGVTATPFIEDTATPNPNETQEVTPDLTPETTTVTTVSPTATPKPTPTKTPTPGATPRPKNPAQLSVKQELEIKEAYIALIKQRWSDNPDVDSEKITVDKISNFKYFGTYKGGIAVTIMCVTEDIPYSPPTDIIGDIAGYHFEFASYDYVMFIYKDGDFTDIFAAHRAGMLSIEDVRDIYWYYNHQ